MSKKSSSRTQQRAAKTGQRTIARRNRRHQYSPKPSRKVEKRRAGVTGTQPVTGAAALMALLWLGQSHRSLPWMGRGYLSLR